MGCFIAKAIRAGITVEPSTNAPSMGCFTKFDVILENSIGLQPTHPVWGASKPICHEVFFQRSFNQRTQYGVLPAVAYVLCLTPHPSTNAPSMGCFLTNATHSHRTECLQPTHPVWGASAKANRLNSNLGFFFVQNAISRFCIICILILKLCREPKNLVRTPSKNMFAGGSHN